MTISMGSMGAAIGKMIVENAIENERTSKLISESAHLQERGQIHIENANKEQANNLRSAMSYVEMASSAVSVGRSGAKAGQEIGDVSERLNTTGPQLEAGLDSAKANAGTDGATDRLENVRLGQDGPLVGERFNDRQIEVLTSEGPITQSEQELTDMGFSKGEAQQLRRMGADGLSRDEAVEFMWSNRQTAQQKQAEQTREKIYDAVQKITVQTLTQGLSQGVKRAGKQGQRASEEQGKLDAIGDEARELGSEHLRKIDNILTDGLRDSNDPNKRASE